jgi:hypothetical protein
MAEYPPLVRAVDVTVLDGFRVRVTFDTGEERELDLAPYLEGPVFAAVRADRTVFAAIQIDGGALSWPCGADIDPDVLYHGRERLERGLTAAA